MYIHSDSNQLFSCLTQIYSWNIQCILVSIWAMLHLAHMWTCRITCMIISYMISIKKTQLTNYQSWLFFLSMAPFNTLTSLLSFSNLHVYPNAMLDWIAPFGTAVILSFNNISQSSYITAALVTECQGNAGLHFSQDIIDLQPKMIIDTAYCLLYDYELSIIHYRECSSAFIQGLLQVHVHTAHVQYVHVEPALLTLKGGCMYLHVGFVQIIVIMPLWM